MRIDLYKILGVSRHASQDDIKKAYRKLAMKYHPDTGSETASAEMFRKVNKAYQILSEPRRRRWYDRRFEYSSSQRVSRDYHRRRAMAYARYRYYAQKQARQQKSLWKRQDFLLASISLLVIFLSVYLFNDVNSLMVKRHDTKTVGQVYSTFTDPGGGENLHYRYIVDDSVLLQHESRPTGFTNDILISDKGIPIIGGYEFIVWFNPRHPNRSVMDFDYPSQKTLKRIQKKAAGILSHKENMGNKKAHCLIDHLYQTEGLDAIGHILCSHLAWYKNSEHNKTSYRKLKRSDTWKQAFKKCR